MEVIIILFMIFWGCVIAQVSYHKGWQAGAKEVHRRAIENLDHINSKWPVDWFKIYTMINWIKPKHRIPMPKMKQPRNPDSNK